MTSFISIQRSSLLRPAHLKPTTATVLGTFYVQVSFLQNFTTNKKGRRVAIVHFIRNNPSIQGNVDS